MKTLKLEHSLADMVRNGEKTSTWRVFDDKDLRVNDEIGLIDKVDPSNPETWKTFAVARIDLIIEKRLGDITKGDFAGHEPFVSRDEMLKSYRQYYGSDVNFDTPIKMIHFSLKDNTMKERVEEKLPKLEEAKMYADGGSRGNPGPSASGFAIMNMDGQIVVKKGVYLGVTTNNQAEYHALRLGLVEAQSMSIKKVHVYMDSMLVVKQMQGIFKVKNRDLWPIHQAIKDSLSAFQQVTFTHVPRELNKIADAAVNEALDEAAASQ